jgi:uncharacterized protein YfaP (DUF2135 family)
MLSSGLRSVGWLRGVLLLVTVLAMLSAELGRAGTIFAKEIDLTGTVDCGQRSGKRCSLDDTLVLLTDQVAGVLAPAKIDITWIKSSLPALDQDDEVTLTVQMRPNGTLQAVSILSDKSRSGTVNQGISTGSAEIGEARHDRAQRQDEDAVQSSPDPSAQVVSAGTLAGTVVNLLSGAPIAGATVTVNGITGTTNGSGAFTVSGIAPGTYQASASASGFVTRIQMVTIAAGTTTQATFSLVTAFQDVTITLIWGSQPTDLDAHLSGPASGGGRFHAFFLNPNPEQYVSLTARDDDGFGPEQIVIKRNPATGLYVPGDYHFWVHNFSGTPSFNGSQARVVVNKDTQFLGVFDVNAASGSPQEELWYVINVQIDGAGNVTLVSVQLFVDDAGQGSFQVLVAPPYGPKREPEH